MLNPPQLNTFHDMQHKNYLSSIFPSNAIKLFEFHIPSHSNSPLLLLHMVIQIARDIVNGIIFAFNMGPVFYLTTVLYSI